MKTNNTLTTIANHLQSLVGELVTIDPENVLQAILTKEAKRLGLDTANPGHVVHHKSTNGHTTNGHTHTPTPSEAMLQILQGTGPLSEEDWRKRTPGKIAVTTFTRLRKELIAEKQVSYAGDKSRGIGVKYEVRA